MNHSKQSFCQLVELIQMIRLIRSIRTFGAHGIWCYLDQKAKTCKLHHFFRQLFHECYSSSTCIISSISLQYRTIMFKTIRFLNRLMHRHSGVSKHRVSVWSLMYLNYSHSNQISKNWEIYICMTTALAKGYFYFSIFLMRCCWL